MGAVGSKPDVVGMMAGCNCSGKMVACAANATSAAMPSLSAVGASVSVAVGVIVGVGVGVSVMVALGVTVAVIVSVNVAVGVFVSVSVTVAGMLVSVGANVGSSATVGKTPAASGVGLLPHAANKPRTISSRSPRFQDRIFAPRQSGEGECLNELVAVSNMSG